jgi:hypothetical protein
MGWIGVAKSSCALCRVRGCEWKEVLGVLWRLWLGWVGLFRSMPPARPQPIDRANRSDQPSRHIHTERERERERERETLIHSLLHPPHERLFDVDRSLGWERQQPVRSWHLGLCVCVCVGECVYVCVISVCVCCMRVCVGCMLGCLVWVDMCARSIASHCIGGCRGLCVRVCVWVSSPAAVLCLCIHTAHTNVPSQPSNSAAQSPKATPPNPIQSESTNTHPPPTPTTTEKTHAPSAAPPAAAGRTCASRAPPWSSIDEQQHGGGK